MKVRPLTGSERERLAALAPTYPDVGATRQRDLPGGYHHQDVRVVLGTGRPVFDRAAERLLTWQMHRRCGFSVAASTPQVAVGTDVALRLGPPLLGLGGACRVLWVEDGRDRVAWAYGTLPGHAESGEESFEVRLGAGDRVVFRARSFSLPQSRLFRTLGPVGRVGQAASLRLYAAALR